MNIGTQSCDEIQAAVKAMMSGAIDGGISEFNDSESLARHLDDCRACRAALDAMMTSEPEWSEMASVLGQGGAIEQRTSQSVNAHYEFGTFGLSASEHQQALFISCLSPTDDPDSLGRIGTLEIRGVIGFGGAGIVYKAIDPTLGRTVAVKLLNPAAASDEARARFSREARSMAAITHENVLPVHAVSQHNELPYLVTEYVPGGTLAQRLAKRGRLELIESVRVGLQIARGLAAAHRQGVVHRDVKPSNILLDPGVERVRVADFGLARAVHEHTSTESGKLMGTPQFMSPEQVQGGAVSFSSDLFSFGSVLFHCCTGRPPFEGDSIYSIMQKITNEEPPSPKYECDDVPDWLDQLIRRLHSRLPSDRFENADTVAEILEAELLFLQQPTLVSQPERAWLPLKPSPRFRDLAFSRRNTVLTVGILSFAAFMAFQLTPDEPAANGSLVSDAGTPAESNAPQAESAPEESSKTPTVRAELKSWVDQLVEATDHREVAFGIGPKLSKLPNDDSLAIAQAAWPRMLESKTRTGLLKAFHFGNHPNVLQVLNLGMTDDDSTVSEYAASYVKDVALRSFAPGDRRYDAWFAAFGDKPLAEVFAAGYQQLAASLQGQSPAVAARILEELNYDLGGGSKKTNYPQKRDAVIAAGLPELIIDLFQKSNGAKDSITPFTLALQTMPISKELAESRLRPLLADDRPLDVRVAVAQAMMVTHPDEATETLFQIIRRSIENREDPQLTILHQVCSRTIGESTDASSIPRLIAIMDSDNSPRVRSDINHALCDSRGLGQFTNVEHSSFHDGLWWRKWWVANRDRMRESVRSLDVEDLPKTKFGMAYKAQNADTSTHEGRIAILRQEFAKLGMESVSTSLWDATTALAEAGDPKAIPVLIGVIEADNSYDTIYGAGYFGLGFGKLGKLTGVEYSDFHDGAWWRRWWEANKQRFSEAHDIPIEEFPKTVNGRKHVVFPADLDTHEGRVRFLEAQLSMKKPQADLSDIADLFTEYDDPRGIPVLIGVIAADKSGKSVYDIGYFGLGMGKLGKRTGVRYDESHDADWWLAWWATHRRDFPAEANVDIPKFYIATKRAVAEAPDADVQDIHSQEIRVADDPNQRYFLIGDTTIAPPESGFKLLVVLPGGDGSADFEPFVRRIRKYALDENWIIAQPLAVFWNTTTSKDQQVVWPKKFDNVADAKFTTEEFVNQVIADVKSRVTIDPANVITLSWSSSGHAAYAIAMQPNSQVTGSYIAMSVFRANEYDTAHVKGRRLVIDHSPDDQVCPYDHSVTAEKTLTAAGAEIKRLTYEGGHGWRGDVYGRIIEGLEWLTQRSVRLQD